MVKAKRNDVINIRISKADKSMAFRLARLQHRTLSNWLVALIREQGAKETKHGKPISMVDAGSTGLPHGDNRAAPGTQVEPVQAADGAEHS